MILFYIVQITYLNGHPVVDFINDLIQPFKQVFIEFQG